MTQKPKLSLAQIINMSIGFMGIQFGFALQNANASRIFETLGAKTEDIPGLWVAAPLTGLIVQPIIGYFSDKTWGKWGRRKPYFFIGAVLSTLALFFMPNSPTLWAAAVTLWLLDASINVSMEPFRAFVGDNLPNSQRTLGYSYQSFFIGVGAMVASALPLILNQVFGIANTAEAGIVPPSVKISFYIGGLIFLGAVLFTILKSKEYSPAELKEFDENHEEQQAAATPINYDKLYSNGWYLTIIGVILSFIVKNNNLEKDLFILSFGLAIVGLLFLINYYFRNFNTNNAFFSIVSGLQTMPKTMKSLAVVQFFTWFSLFSMWIYTTKAVTGHIYGSSDPTSEVYASGADWVGILFTFYSGVAMVFALAIPQIAKKLGTKFTHSICLLLGGLGLISMFFISDPNHLLLSMLGVGIAWSSILSLPYALLSKALPADKMGYYMGVFNFFIVIPQIVAASILGFLVKNFFNNQPIYALMVGGFCMILAACITVFTVKD